MLVAAGPVGCATARETVYSPRPSVPPRGVILVADGAGNFQAASAALRAAVTEQHLPLAVETFEWSHGYPRILSDHMGYGHARAEGQRLAAEVLALRQNWPDAEIYLVGHSAGCGVILAAAECLPGGCVDRIVLLAPSLSVDYDLRPALRSVRGTVDVFYSTKDKFYLALVTGLIGTSDRHWAPAGGRYGFRPQLATPEDVCLYSRLRQFPWQPSYVQAGNLGGHYGTRQPDFLRLYVLPLFQKGVWAPDGAAAVWAADGSGGALKRPRAAGWGR
jgi:pimeloyl-ACP methyl ester carboxylesterase